VLADRFGIGTAPKVLAAVGAAVAAWPDFGRQAGVDEGKIQSIRNDLA